MNGFEKLSTKTHFNINKNNIYCDAITNKNNKIKLQLHLAGLPHLSESSRHYDKGDTRQVGCNTPL